MATKKKIGLREVLHIRNFDSHVEVLAEDHTVYESSKGFFIKNADGKRQYLVKGGGRTATFWVEDTVPERYKMKSPSDFKRFEHSCRKAAEKVISQFDWLPLPDGPERVRLISGIVDDLTYKFDDYYHEHTGEVRMHPDAMEAMTAAPEPIDPDEEDWVDDIDMTRMTSSEYKDT